MKVIYNNKEVANTTLNYNQLLNKPLLNSRELVGNVSLSDINVYDKSAVDNLIASTRSVKAVTSLPSPLVENTMYYVGPDADDNYHVYLVDSALTLIDLGMAKDAGLYKNGVAIDIDTDNKINVQLDYTTTSVNSEGNIEVPTLKGNKGANDIPVYLADGQITASNATVGSSATDAIKPIYMNSGKITASSHTVGGTAKPVYVDSGTIKPISATVGNEYTPVYLNSGTITQARILLGSNSSQAAVTLPAIPVVSNDLGAMEVGQIIDFHTLTSGAITPDQNFAARIQFAPSNNSLILWNEEYGGVQQGAILTEKSIDNTSLKVDSSTHKVYVPTTASGDRFGVYPYTDASGITHTGSRIYFYDSDAATSHRSTLKSVNSTETSLGKEGDPYWYNEANSSRNGVMLTSAMIKGCSAVYLPKSVFGTSDTLGIAYCPFRNANYSFRSYYSGTAIQVSNSPNVQKVVQEGSVSGGCFKNGVGWVLDTTTHNSKYRMSVVGIFGILADGTILTPKFSTVTRTDGTAELVAIHPFVEDFNLSGTMHYTQEFVQHPWGIGGGQWINYVRISSTAGDEFHFKIMLQGIMPVFLTGISTDDKTTAEAATTPSEWARRVWIYDSGVDAVASS